MLPKCNNFQMSSSSGALKVAYPKNFLLKSLSNFVCKENDELWNESDTSNLERLDLKSPRSKFCTIIFEMKDFCTTISWMRGDRCTRLRRRLQKNNPLRNQKFITSLFLPFSQDKNCIESALLAILEIEWKNFVFLN